MRHLLVFILIISSIAVSSCGFEPIYATPENATAHPFLRKISVTSIISTRDAGEGNLAVQPILRRALDRRLLTSQQTEDAFDLMVEVTPVAVQLAVQIDASVTRFNYRLASRYRLVHRETGVAIEGTPRAIASFNQVNSQYSSLFAEREAVEKSATRLAEEIERDILIQSTAMQEDIALAIERKQKPAEDANEFETTLDETVINPLLAPDLIP